MKVLHSIFLTTIILGAANARLTGVMKNDVAGNNRASTRTQQRKLKPPVRVGDGFELEEGGRKVEAKPENNGRGAHVLTFNLGPGKIIQAKSSPRNQEIEIRLLGTLKTNNLSDDDRTFLEGVAKSLEDDATMDTYSVDTTPSQTARMSHLLAEWPQELDIDFVAFLILVVIFVVW